MTPGQAVLEIFILYSLALIIAIALVLVAVGILAAIAFPAWTPLEIIK